MTTGPGDEKAAGGLGRGHLRASHADRERVIAALKAAFVQGRLTKDELDVRVGQVLAARTYADLAALTADLPGGLPGVLPPDETVPVASLVWLAVAPCALVAVATTSMVLPSSPSLTR